MVGHLGHRIRASGGIVPHGHKALTFRRRVRSLTRDSAQRDISPICKYPCLMPEALTNNQTEEKKVLTRELVANTIRSCDSYQRFAERLTPYFTKHQISTLLDFVVGVIEEIHQHSEVLGEVPVPREM